jgi:hypothetical protein
VGALLYTHITHVRWLTTWKFVFPRRQHTNNYTPTS